MTILKSWFFIHRVEPDVVVLIDCSGAPDCGARSITNDINNVVAYLWSWQRLKNSDLLVYKDTDEGWDGVWHKDGKFLRFELLDGKDSHLTITAMRKLAILERGGLL